MAKRVWVTSEAYDAAIQAVVATRHEQGVSQRDLASRLGKPRSFVSKIENKERRLDMVEFVMIARGLNVAPADLLKAVIASLPADVEI